MPPLQIEKKIDFLKLKKKVKKKKFLKKKSFKRRLNKADQGLEVFDKMPPHHYMPPRDTTIHHLVKELHPPAAILCHQTKVTCRPHTADLLIQVSISNSLSPRLLDHCISKF